MCQVIQRWAFLVVLAVCVLGTACASSPAEGVAADDDFRSAADALNSGIPAEGEAAVAVGVGFRHACVVVSTGRVACWGQNRSGQRGDGTTDSPESATFVGALLDATDISAGWDHTCALRANGMIACWGNNSNGQLGDGTTESSTIPVSVEGIDDAIAISASTKRSCALLADTTVRCWGRNDYGEAGVGTEGQNVTIPAEVNGLLGASTVSTGPGHTCATTTEDVPFCWGRNGNFQLGNEDGDALTAFPVEALAGTSVVDVAVNGSTSCALRSDGDVLCWGANDSGQFGRVDATITTSSTPVLVQGAKGVVRLGLGDGFGCALDEIGSVQCWGTNTNGQLGRGETAERPQRSDLVLGLDDASDLAVGSDRACAVYSSGLVKCWGADIGDAPVGRAEFSAYAPSEAAASAANDLASPAAPINALDPNDVGVGLVIDDPADKTTPDGAPSLDEEATEPGGEIEADGEGDGESEGDSDTETTPEIANDNRLDEYSAVIDRVGRYNENLFCSFGVGSDETLRLRDAPSLDSEILTEMPGSRCQLEYDPDLEEEFTVPTPTPAPSPTPTPTPTPLPEGQVLPRIIGETPTPTAPTPTPVADPLAGWTAVRFDGPQSGDLINGWVSSEFLTSRSARSVIDTGSVLGVYLSSPTEASIDTLQDILGSPEADRDWSESCLGGEARTLQWGNLTVEFRRDDPAYEGLLMGAELSTEGPFIAGATIVPGTSTWGDLINETPRARSANPTADGTQRWTSHDISNRGFASAYSGTFMPVEDGQPDTITAARRIGEVFIGTLSSHCSR